MRRYIKPRKVNAFPRGPFSIIMADPPWPYDSPRALVGNGGRGSKGASTIVQVDVNSHYETMNLDDIKAMPIASIAAKDACLLLWTTNPFLADGSAVDVVRSWGFAPKSVVTWAKVQADLKTPSMKTGHWFRSASEHFIFATRGRLQRPVNFPAMPTWQPHPRLPHSRKPDLFFNLVEKLSDGPCIELFARGAPRSPRWVVWGNQAGDKNFR